jgi:hypothetical protein
MPMRLLEMYAKAMPRLEAEETMSRVSETQAATGHMTEGDHKAFIDGLMERGQVSQIKRIPRTPMTREQFERAAGGISGFRVLIDG